MDFLVKEIKTIKTVQVEQPTTPDDKTGDGSVVVQPTAPEVTPTPVPTTTATTTPAPTPSATPTTTVPSAQPANETVDVRLYYRSTRLDPYNLRCAAEAYVIRKLPKSSSILTETMKLLLSNRLTTAELEDGLTTEFGSTGNPTGSDVNRERTSEGFKFISAQVSGGTATLKFTDTYGFTNGGSCRVSVMRDQIIQTAKQFNTVKSVQILPTDSLFQP